MATCQIKKQRAEWLRVVGVSPSRKKTAVCTANDLNYCLHRKSRACTAICQIKKQRAERLRVVGVSPSRKKTAVCTANDLNYCLYQNQTKKNINFLEKRISPKGTFLFISECDCIYIILQPRDCHSNISLFFVVHAI